ncbi:MAG: tripartite tricarboxylate transporter substrate binding protein [Pseudomonadales bacterium]|nr:tripartite tricarboxylate transporter substrate binding protein [Pseudomonadales bacterium]MCP5185489.1 tripartite tricarboxylate transporter substrate binding protein [Pseudomonadales bacterium]
MRTLAFLLLLCGSMVHGDEDLASLHFLVPGGAGGGWDTTARATGSALIAAGLVDSVSFENRSGAGGGRGFSTMLDPRARTLSMVMVSSTPILVRSQRSEYRQNWRQLTPVASMIGDYGAIMVRADAPLQSLAQLVDALRADPRAIKFAGGSNRGDTDHLILAAVFQAVGLEPAQARYVPYGAGGQAMLALLSGETGALASTVGESIHQVRAGNVRVLAILAPERLPELPRVPTFTESGYPVEFLNWRGFFAVPDLEAVQRDRLIDVLTRLRSTEAWQAMLRRYSWVPVFHAGDDFARYLDSQETQIRALMHALGFLG